MGERAPNARLLGDGMPVLLSSDEFYGQASEQKRRKEEEERRRELASKARKEKAEALRAWHESEKERKRLVEERKHAYREEIKDWEARKARAKVERRHFGVPKPVLGLKFLPKALPRPRIQDKHAEEFEELDEGEFFNLDVADSEEEGDDNDGGD